MVVEVDKIANVHDVLEVGSQICTCYLLSLNELGVQGVILRVEEWLKGRMLHGSKKRDPLGSIILVKLTLFIFTSLILQHIWSLFVENILDFYCRFQLHSIFEQFYHTEFQLGDNSAKKALNLTDFPL